LALTETQLELPNSAAKGSLRQLWGDYKFFFVAFGIVLLDQLVKLAVKFTMQPYEEIKLLGEFFRINYIENKGAAFGLTIADLMQKLGIDLSEETAKLALTLFSVLAVMVLVYLLQQVRNAGNSLPFFLAMILGGATGNIIDRVFYGAWFAGINDYEGGLLHGRVVDMFYVNLVHGKFLGMEMNLLPVFNIADAAIAVGIIAIIFFQRTYFRASEPTRSVVPPEVAATETQSEMSAPSETPIAGTTELITKNDEPHSG
jgi:signal peptidase II